ncbi:FRIGIDA-like protein 3 [Morus notabilis]|nr:FRIGIDA-like protein 3 [Morus notabilis]
MLVFSLQWKDLENHFESTRKSLRVELEILAERERQLEVREAELNSNLDSKAKELEGVEKLIGEQAKVLELNLQHVDSLKSLIQENREELEVKEKQYVVIQNSIAEKEREFASTRSSLKEGEEKLESLEKRIKQKSKEAESKEKELDSIQRTLRGYKDDIEFKDRKFNAIRRSLEERKKEFELKEGQLKICRSSIDECEKEIKLKEENLISLRNSIAECSNELELKQKQLDLVQKDLGLKEKEFVSLKQSVDQCSQQFEMKERKFQDYLEKLELKEKFCESKSEELDSFHKKVNECLKECELKKENLSSLKKLVQKRSCELEAKESQFNKNVNEFEMRRKELDLSQKSNELREKELTNILPAQVKVEQPEYTHANNAASCQSITKTGKDLQFLLNRHLMRHDSVCGEIFSVLQASPDSAKLVLDAMEGFYPVQSSGQNSEFDVNIVRRSCILLLEQLMESSPQINPQVREAAIKLAGDWKAKMTKENYLESLGFLQFLTSYKLSSAFDADELRSILDIVSQQRQGSELRQVLSTADKAPVTTKIEQAENSSANVVTSSSNLQLSTTQNDVIALLETSCDPAKLVLDHIHGYFSQHWKRGDASFEENSMRNYILLFEKLFRMSPKILPMVKEDAMKLAREWKTKMRPETENQWEVLGFLQFLVTYRLVFSFGKDEILKFLETVCQHKEALELCRTLGIASKIPEFVRDLIRKKKLVDAVALICTFKLTKFSPLTLLTKYMENLKEYTKTNCKGKKPIEERDKITDDEIAALTAVIKCILDYNLDSKILIDISKRLKLLEQMKRDRKRSAQLARPKIEKEQQQRTWKKRKNDTFVPQGQPQHGNNKFPRTSSSTVRPHGPPTFIPVIPPPPLDFPPNPHAFARDPPQFVLGGSGNIISPGRGVFPNAGSHY